jgi:signal transduction histidine kinase
VRRIVIGKRLGDVGVTSTETRPSRWDRFSPRNWSLAWKLVAVGLVPALLAIVLGVLRVADQAETASDLGAANRLLEVRGQVDATASALRDERDRATLFLAERRLGDRGPLQEVIARTDGAVEQMRTATAAADGLDDATRSALDQAEGGLAQLSVLRADVTGSAPLTTAEVVQRYSAVVERTDVLDRALLRQVRTPETAGMADALTAITSASEALALQHTVLGAALRTGTVTAEDRAVISRTDGDFVSAFTEYQVALPPSLEPVNFITSGANAEREAAKSAILAAPDPGPISVTAEAWDDVTSRTAEQVDGATAAVTTGLADAGRAAEDRSSNLAGVNSVILMLGLLLAATIIVLVARTLTRSLRVLRSSALDVAQRRLPQAVESMRSGGTPDVTAEPVPLRTRDEVGQVARAFDAVHGQALRLAADQAALQSNVSSMFVNLSRRSQALVERQLQLIEQLESNEQDPDQLSNLFQLDHLATRMRRNSENLLVLAGTDLAKRNVAAVPLVDVLRAAVSEIEQYQRVVVQAPPPSTVVGRATNDIVHLLAELLDNATNFSPPDSQVVMSSMRNPDGSITVEVADRGVGMNELELDDANRRLTTPSTVDVSTSRRMGLFVVGRLAARHGIALNLGGAPMGGPGGGLTASVTLPAHLVTTAGGDGWATMPPAAQPAVGPNGIAAQRPARMLRPGSSVVPTGREDAAQRTGAPAVNGLPTRTPGSSLRPAVAAVPVHAPGADEAGTAGEPADDQALTAPVPETPPVPTATRRTRASRPGRTQRTRPGRPTRSLTRRRTNPPAGSRSPTPTRTPARAPPRTRRPRPSRPRRSGTTTRSTRPAGPASRPSTMPRPSTSRRTAPAPAPSKASPTAVPASRFGPTARTAGSRSRPFPTGSPTRGRAARARTAPVRRTRTRAQTPVSPRTPLPCPPWTVSNEKRRTSLTTTGRRCSARSSPPASSRSPGRGAPSPTSAVAGSSTPPRPRRSSRRSPRRGSLRTVPCPSTGSSESGRRPRRTRPAQPPSSRCRPSPSGPHRRSPRRGTSLPSSPASRLTPSPAPRLTPSPAPKLAPKLAPRPASPWMKISRASRTRAGARRVAWRRTARTS